MMEEQLAKRKAAYESELGQICYERYQLAREIEVKKFRIDLIDRRAQALEDALRENAAARNDLKTQQAIDKAKEGEQNAT